MKVVLRFILLLVDIPDILYNRFLLYYRNVTYATYPNIRGRLFLQGKGVLRLGREVSVNSGRLANPIGGDTRATLYIAPKAILEIDSLTGISNCAIICNQYIKIGKYVKIGGSVKIYDTDFHSLHFEKRMKRDTDIPISKPVIIEDHCFIGAHSIILKGVTIGEKSIIGAGSVVTKSIPSGEIWGGNPAKFIKKIDIV